MQDNHKIQAPSHLIYSVNQRPPLFSLGLLGIEHGALLISSLMASIVFAHAVGAGPAQTASLISVGLIAGGMAGIMQSMGKWGIGSGYFCLHTSTFIYFHASLAAFQVGGLSLVFGMTAAAGMMQVLLSRTMRRLRKFFPPEVAGMVVAMVGLALAPYAVKSMFGLSAEDIVPEFREIAVGVGTLFLIVAITVWAGKMVKVYAVLFGIVYGYVSAYILGVVPLKTLTEVREMPLITLPVLKHPGFAFDPALILPFLIAAICSSLKLTGDIISCQKINNADWKRVHIPSVQGGIAAEGLGTVVAGLLGGTGLAASSSNIGMSYATGATSRYIGYATGLFFIGLAFFPGPAYILSNMPVPVVGGIVVYAACFMIVTGWSIIMSRMMDSRRTFVVGISLVMGISVLAVPEIHDQVPSHFKPVFGSAIALTAITGVFLNMLFRIGISNKQTLSIDPAETSSRDIENYFKELGGRWGARADVIYRASAAMTEMLDLLAHLNHGQKPITVNTVYDEFNLKVEVIFSGQMPVFSTAPPSPDQLLEDSQAQAGLAMFLLAHHTDKLRQESELDKQRIIMEFED